ncbi:hypothetical protein Lcho_2979 [Leptothrix cholodnii SP-6]|uniref:Uncharacterized protein n=1 Tax=Leptothrix cholodnii (strain ATCC 51168 / LMG 8142 / SP-6) TaxID=395495 RepID=B1XZ71_LEPCP|nr:hypothetical protein [Leptothrix cholodnii]ACB35241.1 hypothetical protein Lcho_2979 [Leptothrix cholodnii SP-6]
MRLHPDVSLALLTQAAALLKARHPGCKATFSRGGDKYLARFNWPGQVVVTDHNTGVVVATSKPGQPTTLEDHLCAVVRGDPSMAGKAHENA